MATKKAVKVEAEIVPSKEVEVFKKQIATAEKYSVSLEVKSDEDYKNALEEGKSIKDILDRVTSRKEEITKPMNLALKSVRELFRPIETAGETALKTIKSKMLSYTAEKDRQAEIAKQKIAERVERGTMKPETAVGKISAMQPQEKTVATETASATTKTVKKWRVVDKSKIPLQFLEPDMVAIKSAFRSGQPVPGVEEYEEKELSLA